MDQSDVEIWLPSRSWPGVNLFPYDFISFLHLAFVQGIRKQGESSLYGFPRPCSSLFIHDYYKPPDSLSH